MLLSSSSFEYMNWGKFSLTFAIDLLQFIRSDLMNQTPPLRKPMIYMPSIKKLMSCGKVDLAKQVTDFGGCENVARRLGLAIFEYDQKMSGTTTTSTFVGSSSRLDDYKLDEVKNEVHLVMLKEKEKYYSSSETKTKGVKKKEQWTEDVMMKELHRFLHNTTEQRLLPSVWMPRPCELLKYNQRSLRSAIYKYGGFYSVSKRAGLIPPDEWRSFETFYELISELHQYLQLYSNISSSNDNINKSESTRIFPRMRDIKSNGHGRLYALIESYGGRRYIAKRLNMTASKHFIRDARIDKNGAYDGDKKDDLLAYLDFLIRLMKFIRNNMMNMIPPLDDCAIFMPTLEQLYEYEEEALAKRVELYGGVAQIAQMLELPVFETSHSARSMTSRL